MVQAVLPKSACQQLRDIAIRDPANTALASDAADLTYADLVERFERFAGLVRSQSSSRENVVGICLSRSVERIVAMLGVMQSGGAFLLLDPSWPAARISTILDDAEATLVVADATTSGLIGSRHAQLIIDPAGGTGGARFAEYAVVDLQSLAYIVYTSGSTGTPNGVEISHGNLLNLIAWHIAAFDVTMVDRASHVAGLGFDAAIWEVLPNLCAGATVVLAPEPVRTSPDLLQQWLVAAQITIAFVPAVLANPMIVSAWPDACALRLLLTGGEALQARPRPHLRFAVINNYGPAECTVVASSGAVATDPAAGLPDVGRPIANLYFRLLDREGRIVAADAVGEICIGGASVGRGYRNRPALTARRFVADPCATDSGGLLYRSGDLGRRLPDGRYEFHGRVDGQEKIRGVRVEPDEVAAVLGGHQRVSCCAVVGADDADGDRRLVAYVVGLPMQEPSGRELRDYLLERLPEALVPAVFVGLPTLPLTGNGKLDRSRLPAPDSANLLRGSLAPDVAMTMLERRLASVVSALTRVEEIGPADNFFLLGGHSLLGTQLVMRVRDMLGVELSLRDVFIAQTVGKLAALVEQKQLELLEKMSEEEAQQMLAG